MWPNFGAGGDRRAIPSPGTADSRVLTRSVVPLRPTAGLATAWRSSASGGVGNTYTPSFDSSATSLPSDAGHGRTTSAADPHAGPSNSVVAVSSKKRERHQHPGVQSSHSRQSSSTLISAMSATGEFDTPSSYLDKANASTVQGVGGMLGGALWNTLVGKRNEEEEEEEDEQGPSTKKRRGMAGAILSTAIEAAVFTSAVGYAAYQLWRSRGTPADHTTSQASPPPPPYTPQDPSTPSQPPSRKVTHVHTPRPRQPRGRVLYGNRTSSHHNVDQVIEHVDGVLAQAAAGWGSGSCRSLQETNQPNHHDNEIDHFSQSWASASSMFADQSNQQQHAKDDDGAEDVDDPVMAAFEARLKALISTGQAALASLPSLPSTTPSSSNNMPRSQTNESLTNSESCTTFHTPLATPFRSLNHRGSQGQSPSGIPRLTQHHQRNMPQHHLSRSSSFNQHYQQQQAGGSGPASRVVASPEVQRLGEALDVTARGTGKRWCD